jgi:cysteinyl-tRNA synthetase
MIRLYNTLTRNKDSLKVKGNKVGLYTCGPTVYNYAHLGNLRAYIFEDILKKTIQYNGIDVYHVMNITDVGHLTGDQDMGKDKLEESAKKEKKSAWEISKFYTQAFKEDIKKLNILEPNKWCKATEHIKEQINLIKKLENKGYTYKTKDGIYYDSSKFKNYNKLSHQPLEKLKEGARIEKNPEKKNPTDFALWKFSPKDKKRQMEWASPWGKGFPGWHIECCAMSLKYLKNNLDIHCGAIDLINVHHTNEIAQAEAATGKKFFDFWIHGAFLNIKGGTKMAKSAGNFLTLENALIKKNINPLAYRYAALQVHSRKPMEYSEQAIKNADKGLNHLYNQIRGLGKIKGRVDKKFKDKFIKKINDDLNVPEALAVMQKLLKSKLSNKDKLATVLDFDKILSLNLDKISEKLPRKVETLKKRLEDARKNRDYTTSDKSRKILENMGYKVEDNADATSSVWKR